MNKIIERYIFEAKQGVGDGNLHEHALAFRSDKIICGHKYYQ